MQITEVSQQAVYAVEIYPEDAYQVLEGIPVGAGIRVHLGPSEDHYRWQLDTPGCATVHWFDNRLESYWFRIKQPGTYPVLFTQRHQDRPEGVRKLFRVTVVVG